MLSQSNYNSFRVEDIEGSTDIIKVRACYSFCLFPRPPKVLGKGDNTFGITKFEVIEILEGVPVTNMNQEITLTGEFINEMTYGKVYTILAKKIDHATYGIQYQLIYINEQIDLHSLSNQKGFLRSFLTEKQVEELYKVYENPLEVIENHDIEGLKKVYGIGPYIANCIINRFEDNKDMSEVYSKLNDFGLTPLFIQKLIKTYKSASLVIKKVQENPYELVDDVDGVGFKTADDIALRGGLSEKSVKRIKAYIMYYLNSEARDRGNSYVTAGELQINMYDYFEGRDNIVEMLTDEEGNPIRTNIAQAMKELQGEDKVIVEDGENKSRRRVYLKYYYDLEKEIAWNLKRLLKADNHFNYGGWQDKVKALEEKQGFEFTEEQREGIKLGLDKQVCLICGLAGSGKSSLVSGILAGLEGYSFAQCALSGKAAARLQEVTGSSGSTIHRLLGYSPTGFAYNKDNPLPYDIIILDEVSLVGGEIFLDLIQAIPDGSKLIMLGDLGQLESIGALNLAADIYKSPTIPTVELTTIHRQAAQSGIIMSAHDVRHQNQLFGWGDEGTHVLGELQDMIFEISDDTTNTLKDTINWFKKWYDSDLVHQDIMNIQLIAPVKERGKACVYNLNTEVQKYVNPFNEEDENLNELIVGSAKFPYHIHEGDKVMCVKNNYNTMGMADGMQVPIYNGWVGIVKTIAEDYVVVDFPLGGGDILIDIKDARSDLVLGYASTVHKLQGSDAPVVIGALDYSTPPSMLTCQLLYTLITRAKKRCVVVGQLGAIEKAIGTDFVSQKRTFLVEMLKEGE